MSSSGSAYVRRFPDGADGEVRNYGNCNPAVQEVAAFGVKVSALAVPRDRAVGLFEGYTGRPHGQSGRDASMKRFGATLLLISGVTVVSPSHSLAQSQAGGLPTVSQRLSVLESAATSQQGQIKTLIAAVQGLQAQVGTLITALAAAQGNIAALQQNVASLQTTAASLQASDTQLTSRIVALENKPDARPMTRGSVLFNGMITAGSGFQVSHTPEGHYTILYDSSPFTATPSCVVTAQQDQQPADGANFYCKLGNATTAGLSVQCYAPPSLNFSGNFASSVRNSPFVGNFQFACVQ